MIRTGWFHGYFACSCRKHYFSQIRGASSFVWNLRKAASSSRLLHVQNSYISNGKRKEITTFQRQYSNKKEWNWKVTRFNSIVLDLTELLDASIEREAFLHDLDEYLNEWISEGKRGLWVRVPVQQSWVVAELYLKDFELHHAKNDYIMMKRWLQEHEEDKMPRYAFHTVGVSGLVLNEDKGEALVVQDKAKTKLWKFAGGFSEPNEDIGATAVREVKEETGITSEFKSLLAFRQQHRTGFDQSDLYFICHLTPLSFDITICPTEISKCEWHPLHELMTSDEATPMTKLVASLAIRGIENGFDDVSMKPIEMTSWVPPYDKKFKVFHRPLRK